MRRGIEAFERVVISARTRQNQSLRCGLGIPFGKTKAGSIPAALAKAFEKSGCIVSWGVG